jgi:hypothetical protein
LKAVTPRQQLAGFIARYDPAVARLARAARSRMRARLPTAIELVYDNYNALAIGFGPSDRASEAIFSLALYPRWVSLFFLQGAGLPDPHRLLRGSGSRARHIVLEQPSDLDRPAVTALISAALYNAKVPMPRSGRGRLVIKSISAKRRSRQPRKPKP